MPSDSISEVIEIPRLHHLPGASSNAPQTNTESTEAQRSPVGAVIEAIVMVPMKRRMNTFRGSELIDRLESVRMTRACLVRHQYVGSLIRKTQGVVLENARQVRETLSVVDRGAIAPSERKRNDQDLVARVVGRGWGGQIRDLKTPPSPVKRVPSGKVTTRPSILR